MMFSRGWPVIMSESWIWKKEGLCEKEDNENVERAYKYAPAVDQNKENEVQYTMEGENVDENVVWEGLGVSV